jgi:pyruvoyl-dependent arginine decarboxylase (PvlArgDC)
MNTLEIGVREFHEKLAYLESDAPVAITRDGDTVGYFMPAPRRGIRREVERFVAAKVSKVPEVRWPEILAVEGIAEEDALNAFRQWRMDRRR